MSRLLQVSLGAVLVIFSVIPADAQESMAAAGYGSHDQADTTGIPRPSTLSTPGGLQEPSPSSRMLTTLFGGYGALQCLDIYSTKAALSAGGYEKNPLMAGNMGQVLGMKAAFSLTTYYAVRNIAKKNRKGAVITMFLLNGVTAAVVAHNFRISHR